MELNLTALIPLNSGIKLHEMRTFLSLAILLLALPNASFAAEPPRSSQRAFKGVELYSWPVDGRWHFSLCPGTNRSKTFAEISTRCHSISGVSALKANLAKLAVGESVFWSSPFPNLSVPPKAIVNDVLDFAKAHHVNLAVAK